MARMIDFEIPYQSDYLTSFEELQEIARKDDPFDVVMEALSIYKFYKKKTHGHPENSMVGYFEPKDLYLIDDEITDNHEVLALLRISLPESELENDGEEIDPEEVILEVTKALAVYEKIRVAETKGLHIGIFNVKEGQIYECTFTLNTKAQAKDPEPKPNPAYTGPYLH